MGAARKPKGYQGVNHETIGSDILSVLAILKLPDQVLGREEAEQLAKIDPNAWYPIGRLLDLMEKLDKVVGSYGLQRMGRQIFKMSHEAKALEIASSAREILMAFDQLYHNANRGTAIGGWKVLEFSPGYAELEKTTPHHCIMEQGILMAALAAVGAPASIEQTQCFRRGGESCIYKLTSSVVGVKWVGKSA